MAAAVAGCTPQVRTVAETVPEGVEAVVTDDERELRERMRPIRGGTRLLVFAIDGLGRDQMLRILDSRDAVQTRLLTGTPTGRPAVFEHAYLVPDTLSVLPSSTIAAWTTVFTGQSPAATGVPGNEFFLRNTGTFYAIAPTSVQSRLQALEAINDGLLNDLIHVPTLYEKAGLRAHVSMSQVYRGADLFTKSKGPLLKMVVRTAEDLFDSDKEVERAPYAALDSESLEAIQDGWEQYGVPDIQVIYLPGLDLYSHIAAEPIAAIPGYYQDIIEPAIAQVVNEYHRRDLLDDTWIMIVSDHGRTPVLADHEHALEVEDFVDRFADAGYELRPAGMEIDDEDFTAVLASQGGLGYVYLANRAECAAHEYCDWKKPPRWREDVRPIVEMLERYNRDPAGLNGKLDAILTRDPQDPDASFGVWSDGALHEVGNWVRSHHLDHQVDFERRLRELTNGPYGGTVGEIVLLPKYGRRYPKTDRYYFSLPVHSEHGSATVADSRFTWLVAHAGMSGTAIRKRVDRIVGTTARQQAFVPLALDLLGLSDTEAPAPAAP